MIKKGYIDTCLLAAYYCPESLSNKTEDLLQKIEEPVISLLTEVEFFSVISKKIRKKELNKKIAESIITNYTKHLNDGYYQKISLSTTHFINARDILITFNHALHSLDALHLAIAITENIPLITADKNLVKVALKMKAKHFFLH
jgi:predicted nucleic acid-binding protein